jgi:DNA-binding response OmpR family regulator
MASSGRVLVVDDDERILFFLSGTLSKEGYAVTEASSGEEALERLRDARFDLAILDLRLGAGMGGLGVLEAISQRWPGMARIILTGHGTLDSALDAIRKGVDAYLLKPVKPDEVRRTVQQVLGSQQQMAEAGARPADSLLLRRGDFVVDLARSTATRSGKALDLTACEFRLLVHLIRNDRRVVTPKELVRVVRRYECDSTQEARDIIKWYIYRLRREVEPIPSKPRHIINVRGTGYTFRA